MLTLRLNVKHSTFAQLMELEVWPSIASSVLMVHSSTRTTSSVTGGSTLTAPLLRSSTLSMMKLLQNVKLLMQLLLMFPENMVLQLMNMQLLLIMNQKSDQQESWEGEETTGEETGEEAGEEQGEVRLMKIVCCYTFLS